MEKQERELLYKKCIEKWGLYSQFDQLLEEMGELIVAINKVKRLSLDIPKEKEQMVMDNFYEEIADVKMCIEQMQMIYGEQKIEDVLHQKLLKLKGQLEK